MQSPLGRRGFLSLALSTFPLSLLGQSFDATVSERNTSSSGPVKAGEGRFGRIRQTPTGSSCFKVSTPDASGGLFVMEHHNIKKGGPPLHLHHHEDEWFYVIEGAYLLQVGPQVHRLQSGDSMLGPREVAHTWAFVGETPGKMLIAYAPAGKMEAYFGERDKHGGSYANDSEQMHAYGMELLGPPLSVS